MEMDHSHMNHGNMDDAAMPGMCSMSMLFTWNTKDLCIIFRWWHIRDFASLLFSLVAIVLLTAGYEALREASRRYEKWVEKETEETPNDTERDPLLWSGRNQVEVSKRAHVIKAALYAFQTFYAFMLMLLFMTYNGWVMLAMFIGSFLGYLSFGGGTPATKETACH